MCTYCFCGDWAFRHDPPWNPVDPTVLPMSPSIIPNVYPAGPWHPQIPQPVDPVVSYPPWDIDKLKEYLDLLTQIKDIEDKLGCPCEPNKADYIRLFKERIAQLEKLHANSAEADNSAGEGN